MNNECDICVYLMTDSEQTYHPSVRIKKTAMMKVKVLVNSYTAFWLASTQPSHLIHASPESRC